MFIKLKKYKVCRSDNLSQRGWKNLKVEENRLSRSPTLCCVGVWVFLCVRSHVCAMACLFPCPLFGSECVVLKLKLKNLFCRDNVVKFCAVHEQFCALNRCPQRWFLFHPVESHSRLAVLYVHGRKLHVAIELETKSPAFISRFLSVNRYVSQHLFLLFESKQRCHLMFDGAVGTLQIIVE